MTTILLYTRRNVGLYALSFLKGMGFKVKVLTDDNFVKWLASSFNCELVSHFEGMGEFDVFISVHGNRIVPMKYLEGKVAFNIHPCLFKYPGKDPIKKYVENKDTIATVESHYMIEEVDKGEVVHREKFETLEPPKNHAEFYNQAVPFYYSCLHTTLEKLNIKP